MAQPVALAVVQITAPQQVAEADDAVERGADLMAHVGQEFRLDAVGFQRLAARHVELDVLDLDGFHRLVQVLGGLFDLVLHVLAGALELLDAAVVVLGQLAEVVIACHRQLAVCLAARQTGQGLAQFMQRLQHAARAMEGQQQQRQPEDQIGQPVADQQLVAMQHQAGVGGLQYQPRHLLAALRLAPRVDDRHHHHQRVRVRGVGLILDQRAGLRALTGAEMQQSAAVGGAQRQGAHVTLVDQHLGLLVQALVVSGEGGVGHARHDGLHAGLQALHHGQALTADLAVHRIQAEHQAGGEGQQQEGKLESGTKQHGNPSSKGERASAASIPRALERSDGERPDRAGRERYTARIIYTPTRPPVRPWSRCQRLTAVIRLSGRGVSGVCLSCLISAKPPVTPPLARPIIPVLQMSSATRRWCD